MNKNDVDVIVPDDDSSTDNYVDSNWYVLDTCSLCKMLHEPYHEKTNSLGF